MLTDSLIFDIILLFIGFSLVPILYTALKIEEFAGPDMHSVFSNVYVAFLVAGIFAYGYFYHEWTTVSLTEQMKFKDCDRIGTRKIKKTTYRDIGGSPTPITTTLEFDRYKCPDGKIYEADI